ncbi:putative E3 ubiquitin-protein ligase UBR7 isoform X1 [Megalobrama amblycephala]|uniref:putative E3 ubiquitin-protein ligase UBR7 isoform X1 n=1 Tax=Megalobrama amblycephala TaxID=75352 RepID=UPI0020147E4F|nr:putative E3 ubiquitin-protein ligase UBR7 isoform X1 [Megalobrama amblycephala]
MMDQCAVDELYEAFAVLAGSDPDHCSYPKGYMKRQAVFACNTCVQAGMEPAGVCLACANACHDGHDICELYTKRNFRCDCGNEKFNGFKCKLHMGKEARNAKNSYNHNYFGRYCSCDRPYPDEDDQVNEEMIQCIVCEDWFHEKHLDSPAVDGDELTEMICVHCMNRAPFLWMYAAHLAGSPLNKESLCTVHVNAENTSDEKGKCSSVHDTPSSGQEEATDAAGAAGRDSDQQHSEAGKCILKELKAEDAASVRKAAVFWPYYWRAKLCRCTDCKRMYVESGVPFLLDESDTLLAYEEKAKTEALTSDDLLLSCLTSLTSLTSLTHVQQLEVIYQYNDLKDELREFVQQSSNQSKEVTPERFQDFLEELQARKRRRLN